MAALLAGGTTGGTTGGTVGLVAATLEPAERELYVETEVDGLVLRGYVDRLDVARFQRLPFDCLRTDKCSPQLSAWSTANVRRHRSWR